MYTFGFIVELALTSMLTLLVGLVQLLERARPVVVLARHGARVVCMYTVTSRPHVELALVIRRRSDIL